MNRLTSFIRRQNRRTMLMSLLTLGVGTTAYGVLRGRRNRNKGRWQQVLQALKVFPTR
jgi:hypothetical protein